MQSKAIVKLLMLIVVTMIIAACGQDGNDYQADSIAELEPPQEIIQEEPSYEDSQAETATQGEEHSQVATPQFTLSPPPVIPKPVFIPQGQIADTVHVITRQDFVDDTLLVQALQGLTARNAAAIYINAGRSYALWLDIAQEAIGFETRRVNNIWDLVDTFQDQITGYILYDLYTVNVAATLSGLTGAIPVTLRMLPRVHALGLEMVMDARDMTTADLLEQFGPYLNTQMVLNQQLRATGLRDMGIMHQTLTTFDVDITNFLGFLSPNALLLGWHEDEVSGVQAASRMQVMTIPTDHAYNLSFFTSLPRMESHTQLTAIDYGLVAEAHRHYVTFLYSDGDNIQWMTGGAPLDTERFARTRADYAQGIGIPFGWSLAPGLPMFTPIIMDYLYENMAPTDQFVASVSGFAYIHPSEYLNTNRLEDLQAFAELTAYFMAWSDMRYMEILDEYALVPDIQVLDAFTSQDAIGGIFYKTGSRYVGGRGFLRWSNGKPVVAIRESLWSTDLNRRVLDAYEMAFRISQYDTNPASINGYTVINVHAWSHSMDSIHQMVNWWQEHAPHVTVVTPSTFMALIQENVPQEDARPNMNWNDRFDYPEF